MGSIIEWRAVVVECLDLKPCWWEHWGRCGLMTVLITDSKVFASGESSAMGLYEVCWFGSLLGLRIGRIFAVFQALGIIFWLTMLL